MKRIATSILLLAVVLAVSALDQRQMNINSIKKSKLFLYSDITMPTREAATSQALEQLQRNILAWATDRADGKVGSSVSPKDINRLVDTIMVRRAEMYRVFAYVRKSRLKPLFNDWNLVLTDELDGIHSGEAEGLQEKEKETEKPEESIEKPDSVSPQKPNAAVANEKVRTLLRNNFLGKKDGVIEQIKKARNFFELKGIMEPLHQRGDITGYGKYATAEKPEECYLVVYDPAGNIRAVLGKGDKVRKNLQTGKDDSIGNYRGCGAIWFKTKE